jgi:N-sulfoglucosamine sulfohydrolase
VNIIYLHAHDAGRWIAPYGCPVETPALSKLASQSTLFTNAHCCAPTCSPSRSALLTGLWAHQTGMLGLAHRGFSLTDPSLHLAHQLKSRGYHTALAGVQHESWPDHGGAAAIGYDELLTGDGVTQREFEDALPGALQFLRARHDKPFFLAAGFFDPHREFRKSTAPLSDADALLNFSKFPDDPGIRRDLLDYAASVKVFDDRVGQILAALDESGLAQNTLVLCTTDHGVAFPFHKCNLTDLGTGVMLLLRGPGVRAGVRTDSLVSQVDLAPTLLDLAGLAPAPHHVGHSLRPLLEGRVASVRNELFAEVTFHAALEPMRSIRTTTHRYIRRFDPPTVPHDVLRLPPGPVLTNIDDGPTKTYCLEQGLLSAPRPTEELYDLRDPRTNLADLPAHAPARDEHRTRLQHWMQSTNDPILTTPIPLPRTLRINPATGISPREPADLLTL